MEKPQSGYSTHITKTPTHYKTYTHTHTHTHMLTLHTQTHTLQNNRKSPQYKLKQTQCKIYPNEIVRYKQYPKYKFTLTYIAPLSTRTSPLLTSLQNKTTSHKLRQFTPPHYTSHHFTYLHSIPTSIPLLLTTFLTLFSNVFSLQGKDATKLAGNWFQLLMVLFMKENLPTLVLCFLVLTFRL